jgi:hypothetical protein
MPEPREIDCTPNYHALFARFRQEAEDRGLSIERELTCWQGYWESSERASALRTIQRLIQPLAVAAQSLTDTAELQMLRDTLARILSHLDTTAEADEHRADTEAE